PDLGVLRPRGSLERACRGDQRTTGAPARDRPRLSELHPLRPALPPTLWPARRPHQRTLNPEEPVSAHREIRRRHRTAAVSQGSTRPLPKPVPRLTEEMLDEAERRSRGGEILRAIAGDLGVSRQRLAERLRERGVRLRREKPSSEQVLEMCRRYEQGESLARIGERLGFNPSSVRL